MVIGYFKFPFSVKNGTLDSSLVKRLSFQFFTGKGEQSGINKELAKLKCSAFAKLNLSIQLLVAIFKRAWFFSLAGI